MDNPSCQHHRIDNETWKCVECGERMVSVRVEADTVLSASNAAGCSNPHGVYVADVSRQREVVIGYDVTYECERCPNNGTWDCGHWHRGDRLRLAAGDRPVEVAWRDPSAPGS
ncbi:hypothetical protein SEA_MISSDAISY_41 [Mycobacterium phage MissDaisy]|nr:hypothetical protein SEA_MISSDAISY_41 [Mycobacterium phage MissDaisy]